jgi:excisionase family DNA binding protein
MSEKLLSISKAAAYLNISRASINRWQAKGKLHPVYTPGGHRRFLESDLRAAVGLDAIAAPDATVRAIVYARVSTRKQANAGNLQRQKERLVTRAVEQGYQVVTVLTEIASGVNERRPKLRQALQQIADGQADVIVVEFQDRLARFGSEYLSLFVTAFGGRIEVLETPDSKASNEELVEDLIAIVTSFSARIYGKRGGRVARQVKETLKDALRDDLENDDPGDVA